MYKMKKYIFILLIGLMSCQSQAQSNEKVMFSARQFSETVLQDTFIQLLDVRTPEEYAEGHIPSALNINWNDSRFAEQIVQLDINQPVYIYCRSGKRSAAAATFLMEKGFNIIELEGGILQWQEEELPLEK